MFGLKDKFDDWWIDFSWKNSKDRLLLAKSRYAHHVLALKEGRDSPYTHPEKYESFY